MKSREESNVENAIERIMERLRLPAAVTTTAPRQTIRLGSTGAPTKPAAPSPTPTPSKTSEFVPAKPSAPPAKSGARSGALSIAEAEALAGRVFDDFEAASGGTDAARWASLEGVFKSNGHNAPWQDTQSIAIPWPKLVGHARREARISQVFETGLTRSDFAKLSAFEQNLYCKNGGNLRD